MKRLLIVVSLLLMTSSALAVEEIRPLGMASATGGYSGDLRVGNTCTTSTQGKFYCGVNARHIYFFTDNTVSVDLLYNLAAAGTGFPYALGGTWSIDNAAAYFARLGTGTLDNTTYLRGDGTWAVPPGSDSGGTVAWDNITDLPLTNPWGDLTTLPWDNITRTLSSGVTDTELSYVDNVTSPIQTQLNAKQGTSANLGTLSNPTAYRLFLSSGVSTIVELAHGADGTYLKSNGPSASPTWEANAGGSVTGPATATEDNVVTWGADNTALKDSGYAFSAMARLASPTFSGTVTIPTPFTLGATSVTATGTELNYVDGVTSAIQAQIDDKAPVESPTFTGTTTAPKVIVAGTGGGTIDNTVIGGSTAANGTFLALVADNVSTAQSTTEAGSVRLYELSGNGTNYVEHTVEDDLGAGNTTVTWGESQVDFGALNLVTTGTVSGAITILDNVASPTAAQTYGSLNIVNAAITVTLPAAASGMSTCVLSVAAAAVNVDVDGSDVIYLNGTALDAGDKVTSASAAGDFICLVSSGAVNWYTLGRSGTWTDGGP